MVGEDAVYLLGHVHGLLTYASLHVDDGYFELCCGKRACDSGISVAVYEDEIGFFCQQELLNFVRTSAVWVP